MGRPGFMSDGGRVLGKTLSLASAFDRWGAWPMGRRVPLRCLRRRGRAGAPTQATVPHVISYSKDGSLLLESGGFPRVNDFDISIFELASRRRVAKISGNPKGQYSAPQTAVCFDATSRGFYTGRIDSSGNETIGRYDLRLRTWTSLATPSVSASNGFFITHIAASQDGKMLAYSTSNNSVRDEITYFDLTQGKATKSFEYRNGGTNFVASLQFTADSARLVASGPMVYDLNGNLLGGLANRAIR